MIFHSSFKNWYLLLPIAGLIIGLFGSLVGGGGGFFFIPFLTILFNVPAQIAVATSLVASVPICVVGSYAHYRNGFVDVRMGLAFAVAGIMGAFAGAGLTNLLTTRQLKVCFGIYSIIIAFLMLISQFKERREIATGIKTTDRSILNKLTRGSVFGFLAGVITGTFGTAGTAPVQAGLFSLRVPIKIVVGTSLFVSTVNTFSAMGAHFLVGTIDLTLVYFLTAGSVIGSLIGPKLLADVKIGRKEGPIRLWYALGMIAFGVLMIVA